MRVYFTHADGMQAQGGGAITGFTIAGADGNFVPGRSEDRRQHDAGLEPAGRESGGSALRLGGRPGVQSGQPGGPAGEPVPLRPAAHVRSKSLRDCC